jgi:hypothetical protein
MVVLPLYVDWLNRQDAKDAKDAKKSEPQGQEDSSDLDDTIQLYGETSKPNLHTSWRSWRLGG